MDGLHDLGGRQGFGTVVAAGKTVAFHHDWEVKISAINGWLISNHFYNMDEYRHAIERMRPRDYIGASYFARTFTAVSTLCVEKGLISQEELNAALGEDVALAQPSKPGRMADGDLPKLAIGDMVRVKSDFIPGHIRMPSYLRGKTGQIVGVSPKYPFPDAAAHSLASPKQCTFDVRFKSSDLWPDGAEDAEIHAAVFHSYLCKVE